MLERGKIEQRHLALSPRPYLAGEVIVLQDITMSMTCYCVERTSGVE